MKRPKAAQRAGIERAKGLAERARLFQNDSGLAQGLAWPSRRRLAMLKALR
jgi:hypothetical protein